MSFPDKHANRRARIAFGLTPHRRLRAWSVCFEESSTYEGGIFKLRRTWTSPLDPEWVRRRDAIRKWRRGFVGVGSRKRRKARARFLSPFRGPVEPNRLDVFALL